MEQLCPICNNPLKIWYSGCGGTKRLGCSIITCDYKGKEIK
jgi:hypothetical protein